MKAMKQPALVATECKTKSQYEFMLKRDIGTETFQFLNDLIYTESNLKNHPNTSL